MSALGTIVFIMVMLLFATFPVWAILDCTFGSCKHVFSGALSDKEFDAMMELIFSDPKASLGDFNMDGGGYRCWIANGYAFFTVNDEKRFTPMQKIRFWKRMKKWKAAVELRPGNDKLNRSKLNSMVFQKELEDKLSEK